MDGHVDRMETIFLVGAATGGQNPVGVWVYLLGLDGQHDDERVPGSGRQIET